MRCLVEHLGSVEAEQFIAAVMREKFDYTRWQREPFDDVDLDEFNAAAAAWAQKHSPLE